MIVPHQIVGMDSRMEQVFSLLDLGSPDARTVGVWGMAGSGKTTLASAVFHRICPQFEGSCFVPDMYVELKRKRWHALERRMLSQLLPGYDGPLTLKNPSLEQRLRSKRLLVFLDDVECYLLEVHEFLQGCIGPGSRVLVTSRDAQALNCIADVTYEVKELNEEEALQLFSSRAFHGNHPSDYELLSKKVVAYTKGNPLALVVLDYFLFNQSKEEWDSALKELQVTLHPDIHDVLKTSYERLNIIEKNIFLDIACFYAGMEKDYVIRILDSCYKPARRWIKSLIDKALVTLKDTKIEMHILLQEMGRKIVCEESIREPGKRSRLWNPEDIYRVFTRKEGTEAIEAIFLDVSKIEELHLEPDAFSGMDGLKFLKLYTTDGTSNVHLPRNGLEFISDELRYLHWHEYTCSYLPKNFCAEYLVGLELPKSHLRQLWKGEQDVVDLKWIDLRHSESLIELPDLSMAVDLEQNCINTDGCVSLGGRRWSIDNLVPLQIKSDVARSKSGCPHRESLNIPWLPFQAALRSSFRRGRKKISGCFAELFYKGKKEQEDRLPLLFEDRT